MLKNTYLNTDFTSLMQIWSCKICTGLVKKHSYAYKHISLSVL